MAAMPTTIRRSASHRRMQRLGYHLARAATAGETAGGGCELLPLLSWADIARHNMAADAWVVIQGVVYDITAFIAEDGAASGHPGGQEIPLEYAGKDATEFWLDMHGHAEEDIMADITSGRGDNTGLELLPTIVGKADGPPPAASRGPGFPSTNWAGNVVWQAQAVASPETLQEVQEIVRAAPGKLRCVGRSHSFTPVCDTSGTLLSLARMQGILFFDEARGLIEVQGGTTWTVINAFLADKDWAVANLATLPHFTVAGSIAMGTHGSSGVIEGRAQLGNQASQVVALEFVTGNGSLQRYCRGQPEFNGSVVSLGCLGVVSAITLQLVPSFDVEVALYTGFQVEDVIANFRNMVESVDSFSWIVDWPGRRAAAPAGKLGGANRLLVRRFLSPGATTDNKWPAERWGGTLVSNVHTPSSGSSYMQLCTGQPSGVEESLEVYGLGGTFESREVQVEYFVPLADAEPALEVCHQVCGQWDYDCFQITELRVTRGDDQWLSPVRDTDSLVIHFSMNKFAIPQVRPPA